MADPRMKPARVTRTGLGLLTFAKRRGCAHSCAMVPRRAASRAATRPGRVWAGVAPALVGPQGNAAPAARRVGARKRLLASTTHGTTTIHSSPCLATLGLLIHMGGLHAPAEDGRPRRRHLDERRHRRLPGADSALSLLLPSPAGRTLHLPQVSQRSEGRPVGYRFPGRGAWRAYRGKAGLCLPEGRVRLGGGWGPKGPEVRARLPPWRSGTPAHPHP